MQPEFDVVIVGSGPAGVSAAVPLVEAGLRVLMVDGGAQPRVQPPETPYLEARRQSTDQWRWMVGPDFHALRHQDALSPKLRVPAHQHVFQGFQLANRIEDRGFVALGSLATGGLSNAWGCGVARFSDSELAAFPCPTADMLASYERVCRRIGVSGAAADDLSDYMGLDAWSTPPLPLDRLHRSLLERYTARAERSETFRLGHARSAVLTADQGERGACNLCGNCLWGCRRRSLYSAAEELPWLQRAPNFLLRSGFVVEAVGSGHGAAWVGGRNEAGLPEQLSASRVLLAAGALATTGLALRALGLTTPVRLMHCPMAVFLLWLPGFLGEAPQAGFGLGQLSFVQALDADTRAFGSLFTTTGLTLSEFARHMPLGRRYALDVLRGLLPSCVVGNAFLPGRLSSASVSLQPDGTLLAAGEPQQEALATMRQLHTRLRSSFARLGGVLLPGSFSVGRPGGDLHYAASLPMRASPGAGETDGTGELAGLPRVHVIDGASLPVLPEKFHALTIMANADRIARGLAGYPIG
jgi:choline dehydrogenase-like flavoprotein